MYHLSGCNKTFGSTLPPPSVFYTPQLQNIYCDKARYYVKQFYVLYQKLLLQLCQKLAPATVGA